MALLPNYYRWIYKKLAPYLYGTVLELGAGTGLFTQNYQSSVTSIYAVDYNRNLLSKIQKNMKAENVTTLFCDLRGDWGELSHKVFDCVVALDVLEHFEDDQYFLQKVRSVLPMKGKFLLKVPAQSRLYSNIDKASGHYRRYDGSNLKQSLLKAGFSELFQTHMNPLGAFIYSLKKKPKTNFSRTFSPITLKTINLLIPFLAALDKTPHVKGLSLIGVYEKV